MYISIDKLIRYWKIHPQSIMHVGAHLGEEYLEYKHHGWIGTENKKAIWVEAQPDLAKKLRRTLDPMENLIYNYAVWNSDGEELMFNISNNSQSSSLLQLAEHKKHYPEIHYVNSIKITTARLDTLLSISSLAPDFLNLDIQGAESIALDSLGDKISGFKWIYTEVNFEELYQHGALVSQMDNQLRKHKFKRVITIRRAGAGWGDALYIRKDVLNLRNWIYPSLLWFRLITRFSYSKSIFRMAISPYRKKILRKVRSISGYLR